MTKDSKSEKIKTDGMNFWNKAAKEHHKNVYHFGEADSDVIRYPMYEIRRDHLLRILAEQPPGKVLDAGCGNGHIMLKLLSKGWDVQGIDYAEEMVKLAKSSLSDAGHSEDRAEVGDITNLSRYEDNSFDAIYSLGVIEYLSTEQEEKMYKEVLRVLKPDGLFVAEYINSLFDVVTANRFTVNWWQHEVFSEFFPKEKVADLSKKVANLYKHSDMPPKDPNEWMATTRDQVYNLTKNPITYRTEITSSGFEFVDMLFYRFHVCPPMMFADERELEAVPIEHENRLCRHWLGHLIATAFISVLKPAQK